MSLKVSKHGSEGKKKWLERGKKGNIEKWKAASLAVPDNAWNQAFRVIVTKDLES